MISASVIGSGSVQASVSGSSTIYAATPTSSPVSIGVYSAGQAPAAGNLTPVGGASASQGAGGVAAVSPEKPPEMAWMSTRLEAGTLGISIKSNTGYVAVLWWDGTVQAFGAGNSSQYVSVTRTIPTSGPYARSSPKNIYAWPTTSSSSFIQAGAITGLSCSSKKITALSVSDCLSLDSLACDSNGMEHMDISRCSSLTSLVCHGNRLRSLDVSASTSLVTLYCQSNLLKSLDVTKNTLLQVLQCNSNSIPSLNLAYSSSLRSLFCHDNLLATLAISSCPLLNALNCSRNAITSLRALNVSFAALYGANIENNLLQAASLNQFYTDINTAPAGQFPVIYVSGNPGASSDSPSIAVGKGYAVNGT